MIRYNRVPDKQMLDMFKEQRILSCLKEIKVPNRFEGLVSFDIQFRRNNTINIYCGLTKLADIKMIYDGFEITTHQTYAAQSCAKKIMRIWKNTDNASGEFIQALNEYLNNVEVSERWWKKEGKLQTRWLKRFGTDWDDSLPWAIFDREVVLGYDSEIDKKSIKENFINRIKLIIQKIEQKHPEYGSIKKKEPSELDMIGVSKEGDALILIEAKESRAQDMYYAPLQILYYMLEWENALRSNSSSSILEGISSLINAKKETGLFKREMPNIIISKIPKIKPILAIGVKEWSGEIYRRIKATIKIINDEENNILSNLEIWEYPENGNPKLIP
ncbi:MAG: hypothetical protein BWY26_00973 [Elusimicrobia bacterium ADurb.Bin231]|nr:MAG: hypothetical protein BWY26_00973 [Elusimicrobia bacterium ADurb.Bin231]